MTGPLGAVTRAFADGLSDRLAEIPATRSFFATVSTATAGAGPGGNYLVKVTWRGVEMTARSYNAAYTPAVGHRVLCQIIDNQLIVEGRYIN